ncbi:MAG: amidohydrolase family protein [Rubripirellula sp.]|nr:amidohydrolase family protein [Rubripirellula sp.]
MKNETSQVFTARWVLPITAPPIPGGWIRVAGGEITEVGGESVPLGAVDLGEMALLPGLVNAHTHLEFSEFTEPIGQPGVSLNQWIGMVIAARGQASSLQKHQAVEIGMREMASTGTVLAGEIATPPCDYPDGSPQLIPFSEVVGLDPSRGNERFAAAGAMIEVNGQAGISPHAPYSTPWSLIERCVDLARSTNRPLAMHVAESPAERELLRYGRGEFADSLKSFGVWRDGLFPWGDQPLTRLFQLLSRTRRSLVIHGNDLSDSEIDVMARYPNLTVVYCPRTHCFFRHSEHPVARLQAAGVRVALGTDSRASNPDLNLWKEVQHLLHHRIDLPPEDVLKMATVNGARGLGNSKHGELRAGCSAVFGGVSTAASSVEQLFADLAENEFQLIQC